MYSQRFVLGEEMGDGDTATRKDSNIGVINFRFVVNRENRESLTVNMSMTVGLIAAHRFSICEHN